MSVSSTVTILRPMAKVVGVSLSLTLVILASELAFGKAGSISSNMFCREIAKFFYQTLGSHLCSLGERRDPEGTYFIVGTRMLEKAKQIWSLSDGETKFEELSPGDKRLLILKSANELQKGKEIMHRSYYLLSFGLTAGMMGNLLRVPLGSFVVPSIWYGFNIFLVGSTMAFNSHIIGSTPNPGPKYVRGGEDRPNTLETISRGRPIRFHLALLRMRENKGLRRAAALANAVGLTYLAQGGAYLVVKTGVTRAIRPLRDHVIQSMPASAFYTPALTEFIDSSVEALSDTTFLVNKLGTNARATLGISFPKAGKYWKAFEIEYEAIANDPNVTSRNLKSRIFCDETVHGWFREAESNWDCFCDGKEYFVDKTGMLGKNNCSTDITGCRDAQENLEQLRDRVIDYCSNSNKFGNLAGGLQEADKQKLRSNIFEVGANAMRGVKPDFGIEYTSELWKRQEENSRLIEYSKRMVQQYSPNPANTRSPSDLPLVLKNVTKKLSNVTNVSNGGFIENHIRLLSEEVAHIPVRSEDLLRVKSTPAEAAEVIPTVKKVLSNSQTSIKIADGFSTKIKKAKSVHRAFRF